MRAGNTGGKDEVKMAEKKHGVEAAAPASDKKKALDTAIAQIERDFGKGSIMRLGENAQIMVEAIPTGSLSLDVALGIGGVPKGRIIEIYGPESSGKSMTASAMASTLLLSYLLNAPTLYWTNIRETLFS